MRRPLLFALSLTLPVLISLAAQSPPPAIDAALAWEKIQKLRTIVSVMHVTAHPGDEHGGVLAKLSRGDGARVTLLTLTRGEAGDNAIGPERFDALGLIRTEELMAANRHYGVDQQYFTTLAHFGDAKTLDESIDRWSQEAMLRDMVRVIRTERPTILLSRFQGTTRDGHGHHQAAGAMATLAVEYAADAKMFAEQFALGLRPWRVAKTYVGGVGEHEDWTVRIDTGEHNPRLGDSYENVARTGLGLQRSQRADAARVSGPRDHYYRRADLNTSTSSRESDIFAGLGTTLESVAGSAGRDIDTAVARAVEVFSQAGPAAAAPVLAAGLRLTRDAMVTAVDPRARFLLGIKEQQFQDAINAAVGATLIAVTSPPEMPAPVPGQAFDVEARLQLGTPGPVATSIRLEGADSIVTRAADGADNPRAAEGTDTVDLSRAAESTDSISTRAADGADSGFVRAAEGTDSVLTRTAESTDTTDLSRAAEGAESVRAARFRVQLAETTPISTKPYFFRDGPQDSRYLLRDGAQFGRPFAPPPLVAVGEYAIDGVPVSVRTPVTRRESTPYGAAVRELRTVPRIAVTMTPAQVVMRIPGASGAEGATGTPGLSVEVELLHNADSPTSGQVMLDLPNGWTAMPASQAFQFTRAGEREAFRFAVSPGGLRAGERYEIAAIAIDARPPYEYREGYELIDHRGLELRYLYREAVTTIRAVDVATVPGPGVDDDERERERRVTATSAAGPAARRAVRRP